MERSEGRETSEDGRRKKGETVVIKIISEMMKESEMEKEEMKGNEES